MNCSAARAACLSLRGGIQVVQNPLTTDNVQQDLRALLARYELTDDTTVETVHSDTATVLLAHLHPDKLAAWAPGHDTLNLRQRLPHLAPSCAMDADHLLEREILIALLAAPVGFGFPDVKALASQIRVRRHIAQAAQKTALAFKTEAAERPEAFWHYDEERGFILHPGCDLIDALIATTQPEATGKLYDFSCYRATEYVILLGIAQELKAHHPALLARLQQLNEVRAIRSGQFHEVYLVEYGSMAQPLPMRYCVPGDRLWFRNPDERSSDVMGYEGSWVIYMGGGLFSNFWQRDRPFTLESKAIEIYHWRDGVYSDAQGVLHMDEQVVERQVQQTHADPRATWQVLERMLRMRDAQGVSAEGGCIDTTREYPRGVSRDHTELVLPPVDL